MSEQEQQFMVSFVTEAGAATTNKEYFAGVELANLACWVIAERLDSCVEKESAKLAVGQVLEAFTAQPSMSRIKIKEYLVRAHQKLIAESNQINLRVGLLVVVTDYTKIIYAVAGNVRLYHLRQGKVNFRSKDQTLAQVMLDAGNLTEAELSRRNERNSLINFLGIAAEFKPLIAPVYHLQAGDQLLLCNISLWENITNEDIAEAWAKDSEAADCIHHLKTTLLARKPQAPNYIIAAIAVKQLRTRRPWLISDYGCSLRKWAIGLSLLVLILMTGALLPRSVAIFQTNFQRVIVHKQDPFRLKREREQALTLPAKSNQSEAQQAVVVNEPVQTQPNPPCLKSGASAAKQKADSQPGKPGNVGYDGTIWQPIPVVKDVKDQKAIELEKPRKATAEANKQKKAIELGKPRKATVEANKQKKAIELEQQRRAAAEANKQKEAIELEQQRKATVEANKQKEAIELEKQRKAAVKANQQTKTAQTEAQINRGAISEKTTDLTGRATQVQQARTLEATGDDRYRFQKYNEALEYYKRAYRVYRELGMKEAAVLVDRKINTTIKEKLLFFLQQGLK